MRFSCSSSNVSLLENGFIPEEGVIEVLVVGSTLSFGVFSSFEGTSGATSGACGGEDSAVSLYIGGAKGRAHRTGRKAPEGEA